MNQVLKKSFIAAMVLSMTLSMGVTSFAADDSKTVIRSTAYRIVNRDTSSSDEEETVASLSGDEVSDLEGKTLDYFAALPQDTNVISAGDFLAKVAANEDIVILDLRAEEDYAKGHIKGAVNVPFGNAIPAALQKIPNNKPVYVYCYSGQTASQATVLLNIAGIDATNVRSGYTAIAKEEAAANLTTTLTAMLPNATYEVDKDIRDAIIVYFFDMSIEENYGKFNVKPAQLKEALDNKDSNIVVVDIRKEEDYQKGHIAGTEINIPFGAGMQEQFEQIPKGKTIIVQCYSGQTASQTMAGLRLLGYQAYSLSGGTTGWTDAGYELTATPNAQAALF